MRASTRVTLAFFVAFLCAGVALAGTESGTFSATSTITVAQVTCPTHASAAAVAMTWRPGAASGTNIAGAASTLGAGFGTGTGAPGDFSLTTAATNVASGATVQTAVTRCLLRAAKKTLTHATATTICAVNLPTASEGVTFHVKWLCQAKDGSSNAQAIGGETHVSAVRNSGTTVTVGTTAESKTGSGVTTGTLTCVSTAIAGTSLVNFQLNSTSSLTSPTEVAIYSVFAEGEDVTLTPQ